MRYPSRKFGIIRINESDLEQAYHESTCTCGSSAVGAVLHAEYCDLTKHSVHPIKAFLADAMILRAEFLMMYRGMEYHLVHPAFELVPEGHAIPEYHVIINSVGELKVHKK